MNTRGRSIEIQEEVRTVNPRSKRHKTELTHTVNAVTFKEQWVNEAQASEERKELYLANALTKMESEITEMKTSINGLKTSIDGLTTSINGLTTSIIDRMKEELKLVIRDEISATLKAELKNLKLIYKSS